MFRVYLDRAETSVVRSEIASDTYYYIANAQLRRFRDGKVFDWNELDPVLILKTRLH